VFELVSVIVESTSGTIACAARGNAKHTATTAAFFAKTIFRIFLFTLSPTGFVLGAKKTSMPGDHTKYDWC
jgi:hypothetical protein